MLDAIEGAQRQILFETYIWKGDAVGERFKAALAAAADRGVEVYCIYDGFANLVVSPRFKRFPDDEGAPLPDLRRRLAVLRPAPLRPRPPQDPGGRRQGRVRRRLQHRVGVRDRVARHPHPDHRPGRPRPAPGVRRLLEPAPAPPAPQPASDRCCVETASLGVADQVPAQRAAAVDVPDPRHVPRGDQPGQHEHLDDPGLLHPRPGHRRRADGRRPPRASTSGSWCRSSPTTSSPTGSPAGTSPSCSTPASASSGSRTRWCTPRPRPSTGSGRRSAPPTSTGSASRATTRSTSRSSTATWPGCSSRSGRSTSPTASSSPRGEWEARDLHRRFTELMLRPLRPLL